MQDEEYVEPPPPSAERVASRAIILSVISCRGATEGDETKSPEAQNLATHSKDWLFSLGLGADLSDWEQKVLETPFGGLSPRDRINASWLSEAVNVFAWSLGVFDLPSFEMQCDPADAANSLGFLQDRLETVLAHPTLREGEQLRDYNEFIYNLHWRIRDFSMNRQSYDFESLARKAWGEPLLKYGLKIKDKDICLDGFPLALSRESDWRTLASITQERHRASNWLIGYASEDFYEVTADT